MSLLRYEILKYVEVPEFAFGRVIGKSGANIKLIETEHKVTVNLQKIFGKVYVKGSHPANVEAALQKLKQIVDSVLNNVQIGRRQEQSNVQLPNGVSVNPFWRSDSQAGIELGFGSIFSVDWDAFRKSWDEEMNKWKLLPPLKKDFYVETSSVGELDAGERELLRKISSHVSIGPVCRENARLSKLPIPKPVLTFKQCFSNYPELLEKFQKYGLREPTSIQAYGWPVLLSGNDMVGISQAGTGKTLLYVIPALIHAAYRKKQLPRDAYGIVLVLTPTRDLAQQVHHEIMKYTFGGIKS